MKIGGDRSEWLQKLDSERTKGVCEKTEDTLSTRHSTASSSDFRTSDRECTYTETTTGTGYVAMDCEMVGVGPQRFSVLARVTVTGYEGELVLDVFIRVEEKVTDYRTYVSGIRPADLKSDKAISFGECRSQVVAAIEGKILVGHALENDLKILNIHHPMHLIRDTAVYAPFMKVGYDGTWQPRRLVELCRTLLGVNIQQNEHCSMEDARAAMQLYKVFQQEWDYAIETQVAFFHQSMYQPHRYDTLSEPIQEIRGIYYA